jgi:hypothetical protein
MMQAAKDKVTQAFGAISHALKRYRFVFELGAADLFGGEFKCQAATEKDAWRVLETALPGASAHVKAVFNLDVKPAFN